MEKNHLIMIIAAVVLVGVAALMLMPSSQADESTEITVSAAASLTESFTEIEKEFEAFAVLLQFSGNWYQPMFPISPQRYKISWK